MTIPNRTVTIAGVFAEDALTTIPQTPSAGTSYRDTTLTAADAKAGWAYKTIVDSAKFNQAQYQYSSIASQIEKYGFLPWSNLTDYVAGSLCLGSNGTIYRAKQNTGPSSTVKDPTTDSALTYWEDFVGEEYIDYSRLSNCILKIPQSINMELSSGTLTLKSGSVVTAPDGTQLQTTSDNTTTSSGSSTLKAMIFPAKTSGALQSPVDITKIGSGSTLPADGSVYSRYFNTTDSKIYRYVSGAWSEWGVSFPIAIVTITSGTITSIDTVFNGCGYMGKTIFVLPGITGLCPNGLNPDGTMASLTRTTSAVQIYNNVANGDVDSYIIRATTGGLGRGTYAVSETLTSAGRTYIPSKNRVYQSNGTEQSCFRVCKYTCYGDVITDFVIEPVVRMAQQRDLDEKQDKATALNYNQISNCITSIPQDINLTLSGGTLTLAAGSVVTWPDGTQMKMTSDASFTPAMAQYQQVFISLTSSGTLASCKVSNTVSGSTDSLSGTAYHMWYDTTNNVINYYTAGGALGGIRTLPIAVVTISGNEVTSIDKVFNGAGYIGHHGFVLPFISFLLGNGKNADGTLSSAAYTKTNLTVIELDTTRKAITMLSSTGAERNADFIKVKTYNDLSTNIGQTVQYVIDENKSYRLTASTPHVIVEANRTLLVRFNYNGSSVTQFDIEKPIRLDDKPSLEGNNDFLGYNTFNGGAYISSNSATPTAETSDSSARIANTEFVKNAIEAAGTAPRDVTTLWGDGSAQNPSSITLSEPFTNFEKIGVYIASDNLAVVDVYIHDTYWLNRVLNGTSHYVVIGQVGSDYWSIRNYHDSSNPSTTTKFVTGSENSLLVYIYGINRITQTP